MTDSQSEHAGYTYAADGHSLGGGMAQTFALQNDIQSVLNAPIFNLKWDVGTMPRGITSNTPWPFRHIVGTAFGTRTTTVPAILSCHA